MCCGCPDSASLTGFFTNGQDRSAKEITVPVSPYGESIKNFKPEKVDRGIPPSMVFFIRRNAMFVLMTQDSVHYN